MSLPPKPIARPGRVQVFKALYDYAASQVDELSFREGDILYVTDANGDWWTGTCNGKKGLIPSNYVAESTEPLVCPLHEAAKRGNLCFLLECINNNVNINSLDKSGSTPLYWTAHGGHVECLKTLLEHGAEVNCRNKLGDTALHAAAWKGHLPCVTALLEKGANLATLNNEKKSAKDLAHNADVAALLKNASNSSNASTHDDIDDYLKDSDDDDDDDE